MKITHVTANNRKKEFEIHTRKGLFTYPYEPQQALGRLHLLGPHEGFMCPRQGHHLRRQILSHVGKQGSWLIARQLHGLTLLH